MRRFFIGVVVGGLLGAAAGAGGMLLAYPFIFLSGIVASEPLADAQSKVLRAEGTFIHAKPSDPLHFGMGKVSLFADMVRLEADFEVGPGPKYKVLLHSGKDIRTTADVASGRYVDLGRLRGFKGSQNYAIPADVNLDEVRSVVIWCEAFDVLISPADLTFR